MDNLYSDEIKYISSYVRISTRERQSELKIMRTNAYKSYKMSIIYPTLHTVDRRSSFSRLKCTRNILLPPNPSPS
jgi:hypothetical protein